MLVVWLCVSMIGGLAFTVTILRRIRLLKEGMNLFRAISVCTMASFGLDVVSTLLGIVDLFAGVHHIALGWFIIFLMTAAYVAWGLGFILLVFNWIESITISLKMQNLQSRPWIFYFLLVAFPISTLWPAAVYGLRVYYYIFWRIAFCGWWLYLTSCLVAIGYYGLKIKGYLHLLGSTEDSMVAKNIKKVNIVWIISAAGMGIPLIGVTLLLIFCEYIDSHVWAVTLLWCAFRLGRNSTPYLLSLLFWRETDILQQYSKSKEASTTSSSRNMMDATDTHHFSMG